ncbi:MAG: hypothetical protein IE887_08880 [Campylobacterales bacterium]|nr:hypothetical protein [Campylobacterales bacterium]
MFSSSNEEYNMVEFEDKRINHYLHHFDGCNLEHIEYNLGYDCIAPSTGIIKEIIWDDSY